MYVLKRSGKKKLRYPVSNKICYVPCLTGKTFLSRSCLPIDLQKMKRASKEVVGWKQFKLFESNVKSNIQKAHSIFFLAKTQYMLSVSGVCVNLDLEKLQRVQNTAARLICNISKFDHITPTLVKLHWLPVRHRINFKILLITFKVIHCLAPEYLSELSTRKTNVIIN